MYQSEDESSDVSDFEATCNDKTFDKICREDQGPRLSKEPVKAWRHKSDKCYSYLSQDITRYYYKWNKIIATG